MSKGRGWVWPGQSFISGAWHGGGSPSTKNTESCERVNLEEEQVTHKVPGDLPLLQDPTLILPSCPTPWCSNAGGSKLSIKGHVSFLLFHYVYIFGCTGVLVAACGI